MPICIELTSCFCQLDLALRVSNPVTARNTVRPPTHPPVNLNRPAITAHATHVSAPRRPPSSAVATTVSDIFEHRDARRQELDEFHTAILQMKLTPEPRRSASHDAAGGPAPAPLTLPVRFGSHEEYVAAMSPLVLEEIRAEVSPSRRRRRRRCASPHQ